VVGEGAAGLLQAAAQFLSGGGHAVSPALLAAISDSRSPSTWNRYLSPLRAWSGFAAAHGSPWLPADPRVFADFLVAQGARDAGYSQTKARCCAIDALSTLAGVTSPTRHPLVAAVRTGARRSKRFRRGAARPIFAQEIPLLASPPPRGSGPARGGLGRGGRGGLSARSQRARCAAAGHMAVLHDGAFRYDDTLEGQLGDVLFFPEVVDVSIFGSKTDRNLTGQPAALPRDGAGAAALVRNARHGLERLLGADPDLLRSAGARLHELLGAQAHAGPEAMAGWPAPIPALATRLYAAGVPVHVLPIFGRWLFDELTPTSCLAAAVDTPQFTRLARATLAGEGVVTSRVGAHSFRRGRAVGMLHARADRSMVSLVLRHRDPRSADSYVLDSARVTVAASALRSASGGRLGAAGVPVRPMARAGPGPARAAPRGGGAQRTPGPVQLGLLHPAYRGLHDERVGDVLRCRGPVPAADHPPRRLPGPGAGWGEHAYPAAPAGGGPPWVHAHAGSA